MSKSRLIVIPGPMFSGKSEELIRRIKRSKNARKNFLVVKPKIDTRTASEVVARAKSEAGVFEPSAKLDAYPIGSKKEMQELIDRINPQVIGIDEAQFFGKWLVGLINDLLQNSSRKIIVAGLDMDAWGKPFGVMPALLSMANQVDKQTADCFRCGEEAEMTQKNSKGSGATIEVGDIGLYEARCRACWTPPPEE